MEPIITINGYPIGWEWLDKVPLEELNPYLRYPNQAINNNHLHSEHIRLQIREMLQIPLRDITIIDIISLP